MKLFLKKLKKKNQKTMIKNKKKMINKKKYKNHTMMKI